MRFTRVAVSAIALAALSLLLSTCRLDDLFQSRTPEVVITLAGDTVAVLESVTLERTVTVDGDPPKTALPLTWRSSNPDVAVVDGISGLVRGLARGITVISVRLAPSALGEVSVEDSATVRVIAASWALAPGDTSLQSVGDTLCYHATARDAAGSIIGDTIPGLRIVIDTNATVQLAETAGCVVALRNGAAATIEASLETVKDSATLTVRQYVDSVEISVEYDTLFGLGATETYTATAHDRRRNLAPGATIAWNSSDASFVTVDAAGQVTARGEGTAYVRARADDGADSVRVTVAPSGPQMLEQLKSDGTTALNVGDTTAESSVILRARLVDPDADAALMLDVELRPAGTAFSNTPTDTSAAVARGQTAAVTITGLTEDTDYHWQARARGESGATTAWTSFGGNGEAERDFRIAIAEDPVAAVGLGQFQSDGTTEILVGQQATQTAVVFKGTVSDSDPGDQLRLEVELKRVDTEFNGTGTVVSPEVGTGAEASVTVSGIPDDNIYHWRTRVVDHTGRAGPWTSFGGNPESQQDFNVPPLAEAPDAPTDPNQYQNDATTVIAVGGIAFQPTVVLKGRLTDADPGDQLTLEVEVRPVGTAFTNAATHTSTAVASGGVGSITVTGLSEDTEYHWQFRAVDQTLRASSWSSFGANAESAADFRVALPEPPNAPTGLGQFRGSNDALITLGTTIDERTVVFKATVTDPDPGDQIRLEVETKELSAPFDEMGTTLGAAVSTGATATVTIAGQTDDKSYHWRARVVDLSGRTSNWVSFETNLETDADYSIAVPEAPGVPASLGQFKSDASTPIATGGITDQITVVFKATATDPDPGNTIRLEVEAKPLGTAFNGAGTVTGAAVASGVQAQATASSLADNTGYHWRARVLDQDDNASAWVNFPESGNAETVPDFQVDVVPQLPGDPTGLGQFGSSGTTPIPVGQIVDETTVMFRATLTDPDPGEAVRLEVESKPLATSFDEMGTDTSTAVASGVEAALIVSGLADNTDYHWRGRAIDKDGNRSAWVSFGGNPDFRVEVVPPPNDPAALKQFTDDGSTPITVGATTNKNTVVLEATVSDPEGGMPRLEVEVKPTSVAFNATGTESSAAVPSGAAAQVTVAGLGDDTNYHWRARTVRQNGRTSGWVSFGGSDGTTDFSVAVPQAPSVPADSALRQLKSFGASVITVGGATQTDSLVFRARLSDPDPGAQVRLQVEWKLVGTVFDSSGTAMSPFEDSGDTATVTVVGLADDASYHWRVKAWDDTGRQSAWVSFGGNSDPNDVDFSVSIPEAPSLVSPAQTLADSSTTIGLAGVITDTVVVFRAGVSDPDPGDAVQLWVERRPVGTPFQDVQTHTGAFVSGGTAYVRVGSHNDNTSYHWQIQAVDKAGKRSGWVKFGANGEDQADYTVNHVAQDPSPPAASLGQFRSNGSTPVSDGETINVTVLTTIDLVLKATVFDPDPGDLLHIEVEVRPTSQGFTNAANFTGTQTVSSGATTSVTVTLSAPGLNVNVPYHWQVRTCDQVGRCGAWVPYPASDPDFILRGTVL